ncbi:Organic hydroperoxide reductase OsmC/OhrA [Flavobacteriaceae bacterium MAR_2010_188]|nr:Organic hydroperoxide reductase OsmC/OhrA [Flavobacteriaceae bacterium MAR_2010_188]
METHYYNVVINWENTRKGLICSPELSKEDGICIEVATPPEFDQGIPGIWSPEHLFVASVSGCLMTTFLAIADSSKLEFMSFSCKATGKLEKVDGKMMISEISLRPTIVISDELQTSRAMRIVQKAENACLISNSMKSKINLDITVEVKPLLIDVE